jgi:inward rectifier potassium channel
MDPTPARSKPPARQRAYPRYGGDDVAYLGLDRDGWRDAYHRLLTMPNWMFLLVVAAGYLSINTLFAGLYMIRPDAIAAARPGDFLDHFFFSVQTLGGVTYGVMSPRTRLGNALVTTESFVGLLNLGMATGLLFARVSRPTARIMFSSQAVVTPLNGAPTLMLRAANRRKNMVLEAEVSLTLAHDIVTDEGHHLRRFDELTPLRSRSPLFYLTWQIMHRIDERSPLHGETRESLQARNAEILVVIRGLDETFVSTIHARASYLPHEIAWGRRLADIFTIAADGARAIDFARFDALE